MSAYLSKIFSKSKSFFSALKKYQELNSKQEQKYIGKRELSKHRKFLPLYDIFPVLHSHQFIAENATIIGEVQLEPYVNVWFNSVIRGDMNAVTFLLLE